MITNIFPIIIEFDEFQINRLPYSDEELNSLRQKYNSTHSFFRNGDFIYISNKEGDESLALGEPYKVNVYKEDTITASLIKHIFFRSFKERFPKIIPLDFYPFRIYSTQQKDDLLVDLLPSSLKGILCYKKLIEVQLRLLKPNGKPFFGVMINVERNWTLNKSCLEIYNENFDLLGIEVLHSVPLPGLEKVLAPDEELVGYITSLNGTIASVETNDGLKQFPLNELFLRRTKFNISNYLSHLTSEQESDNILLQLNAKKEKLLSAKVNYEEIEPIINLLSMDKDGSKYPYIYLNKDGFCFTISNEAYSFNNKFQLKTPTFIFDYSGNKTEDRYPDTGLNNFGPYDSYAFDIKNPTIVGICNKLNRGFFTNFLSSLIEGLPNSKYFKKGLKKKYDFTDINISVLDITSYDNSEFDKLISKFINKPNLIIIEIPRNFKELGDSKNPYYYIKAKFLSLEIPVQFIQAEKVRVYDEYLLNTIGLQIYAKLGGTPWVLPSARSVDRELIIGIGHSLIRQNAFSGNERNRVVGISTFFSSDGQYLLSNKAKDVPYDYYFDELLQNLEESFNRLKDDQAWKNGDTIRLIFHIFKPIKNVEYDVICELIKRYGQYKIQFAFVTISKNHPFQQYDKKQKGLGQSKIGEYVPFRGSNFLLDEASCIIQMLGAYELKTSKHGFSNPIMVRLRLPQGNFNNASIENLLFTDLSYIVQQVYSFTYLSWRSFLVGEQPATMLYSKLIAKLLGKLRNIKEWDPSVLNFSLKRKKWFL